VYRILIVEDERKLRETIGDYLGAKGYECLLAEDGAEGVELFEEQGADLVLLDIMMPRMDGFAACRKIRKQSSVPILFLTAKGEERDQLAGYMAGADDYLVKPFPLAVLLAKCNVMIARDKGINKEQKISAAGIVLDLNGRKVLLEGKETDLSYKDYELLKYLMENKNITLSRQKLLDRIWGYEYEGDERVVDTHIKRIRKALGEKADRIQTVIHVGYYFREE
jgi:DNA-binding response OmpR family regulator